MELITRLTNIKRNNERSFFGVCENIFRGEKSFFY